MWLSGKTLMDWVSQQQSLECAKRDAERVSAREKEEAEHRKLEMSIVRKIGGAESSVDT